MEQDAKQLEVPEIEKTSDLDKPLGEILPEELKEFKSVKGFLDKKTKEAIPELVRSYLNAQTMVGKKVSQLTDKELRELVDLPNKPEKADDYKNLLVDVEMETVEALKDRMFDLGLDSKQAKRFVEKFKEEVKTSKDKTFQEKEELAQSAENKLHDEFGIKYRASMDLARQAALHIGGQDFHKRIFEAEVKDPELIKFLYRVGKDLISSGTNPQGSTAVTTGDSIKDEIEKLRNDPVFYAKWSKGDKKCIEQMDRLHKELFAIEDSVRKM